MIKKTRKKEKEGINSYLYDKYLDNYGAVCRSFSKVFEERTAEIAELKKVNRILKFLMIILIMTLVGVLVW